MGKLQKFLLLSLSVGLLLLTSLVLQRVLDPDRACLQWDGIHELTFANERVYSCESMNRLERPRLSPPVREWVNRLNRLSRLSWWVGSHSSLAVKIDLEHPRAIALTGPRMSIGFLLAEKPGHLEHAVLQSWIERSWPEHDALTQKVMADILTWAVMGDSEWADPVSGDTVNVIERLRFSLLPQSPDSYCLSPFRDDSHLGDCQAAANAAWDERPALQPLVGWTIWNYVRELPASVQIAFFREMAAAHFSALDDLDGVGPQTWVQARVQELLKHWGVPDEPAPLRRVFYREDLIEPLKFDLTVEVTDPQLEDRTLDSLKRWSKMSPHRRVLFAAEGKNRILPEDIRVDLQAEDIQTLRYVIIACAWPKAKDVMRLKSRLLYAVRVCAQNKLPSWREIMTSQADPQLSSWSVVTATPSAARK